MSACSQYFPTTRREKLYPTLESAVWADSPSLVRFDIMYGDDSAHKWMEIQLTEVLMYTGLRNEMTSGQTSALADRLIALGTPVSVTLSEWMQFFVRFEQGFYKTFRGYSHPNPQVVTESFVEFIDDLQNARYKVRSEREKKKLDALLQEPGIPCPPELVEKWGKSQSEIIKPIDIAPNDNRSEILYQIVYSDGTKSKPMLVGQLYPLTKGLKNNEYTIVKYNNEQQDKYKD